MNTHSKKTFRKDIKVVEITRLIGENNDFLIKGLSGFIDIIYWLRCENSNIVKDKRMITLQFIFGKSGKTEREKTNRRSVFLWGERGSNPHDVTIDGF